MIAREDISDTAIGKIYTTYGRALAVSKILIKLQNDKSRGGHPDLRP